MTRPSSDIEGMEDAILNRICVILELPALKTEYEALYPRRGRLPVQDQVLKALGKVR